MNKAIKAFLGLLLLAYVFVLGFIVVVGYFEGVEAVREGLFFWAVGGAFGLIPYLIITRRKPNHYVHKRKHKPTA
jgi:hypothetical protein